LKLQHLRVKEIVPENRCSMCFAVGFGAPLARSRQRLSRWLLAPAVASIIAISLAAQDNVDVIRPQDVLYITVWEQADLTGRFAVESDGTFAFPLIGRIKAAGLSPRGFETELTKCLADGFLRNPQVRVAVEQHRNQQQIFIMGDVKQPGSYPLTDETTLIQALARAGLTTPETASEILIVRPMVPRAASGPVLPDQAEAAEVIRVDPKSIESIENARSILVRLRDGDTIYVQPLDRIYVYGQVRTPGSYPAQRDTTVLQALALAGGVTDRGSTGRVKIVRLVNGKNKEISAKLTDVVLPGDTLVVPERFF
jgi:polysaccharide export outer membrane protein